MKNLEHILACQTAAERLKFIHNLISCHNIKMGELDSYILAPCIDEQQLHMDVFNSLRVGQLAWTREKMRTVKEQGKSCTIVLIYDNDASLVFDWFEQHEKGVKFTMIWRHLDIGFSHYLLSWAND